MKKKNLAFTLAEVLIVIGIIGVVAALTLPNLNHATGDKEIVTRVKKIYSALNEAFDRAQAIYGPFDTLHKDLDDENIAQMIEKTAKRITEFMKISKYSDSSENSCLDYYSYTYCAILSDGTTLGFGYYNGRMIYVDIDGINKGKNEQGYDWFFFTIRDNLLVPDKDYLENKNNYSGSYSRSPDETNPTSGYYTAWVIENGNLDYLKCPDELNWETKTSCE